MADDSDDEPRHSRKLHQNQPYDESLDIADAEEVESQHSPTPRVTRKASDQGQGSKSGSSGAILKGGGGGASSKESSGGAISRPRRMSDASDDGFDDRPGNRAAPAKRPPSAAAGGQGGKPAGGSGVKPLGGPGVKPSGKSIHDDDDDDDDDTGDDDDEDDDDSEERSTAQVVGAYNPADYEHLVVSAETKDLFQYIIRYTPQNIDLDTYLRPFIPDYIPAVGDIDAYIKIPRPDGRADTLGLEVVDEPCSKQSDPSVLDLTLRAFTKQTNLKEVTIKSIENPDQNTKALDNWIRSISELHRTKPPPNVHYSKNMPDIDKLMEEWPPEVEELLKEITLPTGDVACDLKEFVDVACGLVDIPVYKSRVQSLHLFFTLYAEFKNSQHFQALAVEKQKGASSHRYRPSAGDEGSDRLTF